MARLTAQHPLAHPLMPSTTSSDEEQKVILPFSKRAIDNTTTALSQGNSVMENNPMATKNESTRNTFVEVQNVPLKVQHEEQRHEVPQNHQPSSSTTSTAKPNTNNTLTAKASIKLNAKKKKTDQLNQLPRSIRWRLNLGLLTMPSGDPTTTTATNTNSNSTITTAAAAVDDKKSINPNGTLPAKDFIFNSPNQLKQVSVNTATYNNNNNNNNKSSSQEEESTSALLASLLKYIEDINALKLRCQRSRYEELEQKHFYSNTVMGIADSSQQQHGSGGGGDSSEQPQQQQQQQQQQLPPTEAVSPISSLVGNKMHHVAPGDDPLSALLSASNINNNNNTTQGNGMFGFGKGNRNKKNAFAEEKQHFAEGDTSTNSHTTTTTTSTTTNNHNNNGLRRRRSLDSLTITEHAEEKTACKGSRWADYYSTREVLDVIEKDLNRLPNDHYTVYHEWRSYIDDELIRKRVLESGGGGGGAVTGGSISSNNGNPSSGGETAAAAAAAASAKKGARRAPRQKNRFGTGSFKLKESFNFGSSNNLNNPNVSNNNNNNITVPGGGDKNAFWSNLISNQDDEEAAAAAVDSIDSTDVSRKERADRLSQLLFIYAREHPEIGYRQGMHEILNFILLALEMDLLEQSIQKERNNWKRDIMRRSIGAGDGGGMAGVDSSGQIVVVRLLDQNYLLHDAFALFECVMGALAPAYDAIPAAEEATVAILEKAKVERGESPMEAMVSKIMSKIRFVARDEALFGMVLCMPVPPQIYFAKWVRLMFGREVSGGMKSVMTLWDAFFDLAAKIEHREEAVTPSLALMNVLETAAASMIILIRDKLLKPSMAWDGTLTGDPDPNDGIAYLMNYPPIEDIDSLIKLISSLLLKEKSLSQMYERRLSEEDEAEDPFVTGTGRLHDQNRPRQVAPLPQRGSVAAHQPPLYAPQHMDVAESIGNFAAGLLDIGSRTVDAAISTYQKHQAEKQQQQQHQSGTFDHPLQFGFNTPSHDKTPPRDQTGQGGIGRNDDSYAVTYRNHSTAKPLEGQNIIVYNTNLRDSLTEEHSQKEEERRPSRGLTRTLSTSFTTTGNHSNASNESNHEEASTTSINTDHLENTTQSRPRSNSRSFASRSHQSALLRKSPKSLAKKLDKSVKTLMTHFEQQQRIVAEEDLPSSSSSTAAGGTRIIPEEIWEAMAAIESVKKELLTQDAMEALERY